MNGTFKSINRAIKRGRVRVQPIPMTNSVGIWKPKRGHKKARIMSFETATLVAQFPIG